MATGLPCRNGAGYGTDHLGTGRCCEHDEAAEEARRIQKKEFLDTFRTGEMPMGFSAAAVGVNPSQVYRWRNTDESFAKAFDEARAERDSHRVAKVEDATYTRILAGTASAAEVIFWLKNRDPQRWNDRREMSGHPLAATASNVRIYLPDNGRSSPLPDVSHLIEADALRLGIRESSGSQSFE